jgi:hypothetical protein
VEIGQVESSSDRASRIGLTFQKKLDRIRIRSGRINLHVFFQIFDWIEGYLISGWVGSNRVNLIFFLNQIKLDSNPNTSDEFLGSNRFCHL